MPSLTELLENISRCLFGLICHQEPSLLMHADGQLILLCPRCMGLHSAFCITFTVATFLTGARFSVTRRAFFFVLVPAAVMMPLHWICVRAGIFEPDILARLLTGAITGAALGILAAVYRLEFTSPVSRRRTRVGSLTVFSAILLASLSTWRLTAAGSHTIITIWLLVCVSSNMLFLTEIGFKRIRSLITSPRVGSKPTRSKDHEHTQILMERRAVPGRFDRPYRWVHRILSSNGANDRAG